ncbi:MAG TPA: GNAT family N-acetyltransferase [Acidimicrobiales bacterium]|nr:GNAT family N-acetyltransferase [Acidimicrobiales bacterium]
MSNALKVSWTEDPDDGLVPAAAELATAYWREAVGKDEPGYPVSELAWELKPAPGVVSGRLGVAHCAGEAFGAVLQRFPAQKQRPSWLAWLVVGRQHRRQGVGWALLREAVCRAAEDGRARLQWRSPRPSSAATSFSAAVGAKQGASLEQNRLATADMRRLPSGAWLEQATEPIDGYELVGWDGPCPLDLVGEFAALQRVMEGAPGVNSGDTVLVTRADVRAAEHRWLPRGPYWRLCARQVATGDLVGFTELQLPAAQPWRADQGDTGVLLDHRGLGLGKWLKATNARRLLEERPEVRFVETWNASENSPMLAINQAMGFRTVARWYRWELVL